MSADTDKDRAPWVLLFTPQAPNQAEMNFES